MRRALRISLALLVAGCSSPAVAIDDAGRDASADAATADTFEANDARADAPIVFDAGACAPGDYVLEGTPIPFAPVWLDSASTGPWREVFPAKSGEWYVHEISADLESIEAVARLEDMPLVVDGRAYDVRLAHPVDVASGATLVLFRPRDPPVDHVMAAVYGLDGSRRSTPIRIDIAVDGPIAAAWTGSGYSLLFLPTGSPSPVETTITRVELDPSGTSMRSLTTAPSFWSFGVPTWSAHGWQGIGASSGALGGVLTMNDDGTVTSGPSVGGTWTSFGATYSRPSDAFWILLAPFAFPGPVSLYALDATDGLSDAIAIDPSRPYFASAAMDAEDASTVGILIDIETSTMPPESWFLRVRDGVTIQRLRLPDPAPRPAFLRYLGGRYAIGWGGSLDELVPCR